jgi:hypothetical protein
MATRHLTLRDTMKKILVALFAVIAVVNVAGCAKSPKAPISSRG